MAAAHANSGESNVMNFGPVGKAKTSSEDRAVLTCLASPVYRLAEGATIPELMRSQNSSPRRHLRGLRVLTVLVENGGGPAIHYCLPMG